MPRTKTPTKIHRFKKYIIKNNPHIRARITNSRLEQMANILQVWLHILDIVERLIFEFGISGQELAYYIAYAKEQLGKHKNFDLSTLDKELQGLIEKWKLRGLEENTLKTIQQKEFFLGFVITHILDLEKLLQKFGWYDYSHFDISHFF